MTYDEYMQQLMMQQVVPWTETDPYAPTVYPTDASGGGFIAPPMDKKGNILNMDLANQAKAFNATQDWADINSDPAVLGGVYGETPNYGTTTYKPIPQLTLLQNAAAMGDSTIEGMIANEILSGGSAASALSKIRRLASPTSSSYDPEFAQMVPTFQRQGQGGEVTDEIDNDFLKDIATQFQQAYLSVPVDPLTGQPNYVIDPATGAPSIANTELSELGQWYQDTNTPLPSEQYDPKVLATPQQLSRDEALPGRFADAMKRMIETSAERKRLTTTPLERNPYVMAPEGGVPRSVAAPVAPLTGLDDYEQQRFGNINNPERLPGALGGVPRPTSGASLLSTAAPDDYETQRFGNINNPERLPGRGGKVGRAPTKAKSQPMIGRGLIQEMLNQGQKKVLHKNTVAALTARGDKTRAVQDMLQSQADAAQRRAMMQQLAAQGHTPYNDTMARRRAMAQYGGFGV
jgi:hypothetical protein